MTVTTDGKRQLEQLVTAAELAPGPDRRVGELEMLDAGDARPAECVRDTDADLVVTGVGRLVAEQDEVVRLVVGLVAPDGVDDRVGRRDRPPFPAVGLEQDRLAGSDRDCVAQLLGRLLRSEREDRDAATSLLHDPDGFFDRALLVRADREPEQARVDLLGVRASRRSCRRPWGRA